MIRADAAKRWPDPVYDEGPFLAGAPVNVAVLGELFGQPLTLFGGDAQVEEAAEFDERILTWLQSR